MYIVEISCQPLLYSECLGPLLGSQSSLYGSPVELLESAVSQRLRTNHEWIQTPALVSALLECSKIRSSQAIHFDNIDETLMREICAKSEENYVEAVLIA